ncbi:MAG: translocation/assembly module TamB domain-containing protein, partial [Myxococcales bacterium]
LRVPRDFWIRGSEINVELTADAAAAFEGEQIALLGEVSVLRGDVELMRRRMQVERMRATFTGGAEVNPLLDGLLVVREPNVEVQIGLGGRLREPELQLSSEPAMTESEIALFLATGRGGGPSPSAGLSDTVASGALNYVAGHIGQALSTALPLDVLAFELGPRGQAQRLEAGAYVTERLFVSFVRNLFVQPDENTNEVRAEYQLRPRLSLSTRYGDRQSGAVNLLWERRFQSRAQREAATDEPLPEVPARDAD